MTDIVGRSGNDTGVLNDEESAFHEAGHAVAMWKLGFGVQLVSIEPKGKLRAFTRPARDMVPTDDAPDSARRTIIERRAMFMLAGDVTTRIFRPDIGLGQSGNDHRDLHQLMYSVEDDGDVQMAWCGYLWQRAFTFMAWQGRWYLVVALARQLLDHRTLTGIETERFLRIAAAKLERDPTMPNCVLIGEVRNVASPFHREWLKKSWETPLPKRLLEVPSSLVGLSAQADVRKVGDVLDISSRAYRRLYFAGIHTVVDLQDWSPRALSALPALGAKTLGEITAACDAAGIVLQRDGAPYPWVADPQRWGEPWRRRP